MNLTDEQQDIISISKKLKKNETLKIDACAGSGKTATLIEIAKANPQSKFLYLAFNKAIVEEAKSRFPSNVTIKTTHGLAYREVVYKYKTASKKTREINSKLNVFDLEPLYADANRKDLQYVLNGYLSFLHSAETDFPNNDIEKLFNAVENGKLPLTHDHYLKVYQKRGSHPELNAYDFILLDEAQDINPVTKSIFLNNECKKILVGDTHQSIYAFRGAVNVLKEFDSLYTLHLSNCFRCPESITDKANYFLFKYSNDREELVPIKSLLAHQSEDIDSSAVISRTNSRLITEINDLDKEEIKNYKLIRHPSLIFKPCFNVLKLIQKKTNFDPEFSYFNNFTSLEELRDYADEANDHELTCAIGITKKFEGYLFELYNLAMKMYENDSSSANNYLTTAHSSKGLEFDAITLCEDFPSLEHFFDDEKKKTLDLKEQFQQEVNLYYVALTRAKKELTDYTQNNDEYELNHE